MKCVSRKHCSLIWMDKINLMYVNKWRLYGSFSNVWIRKWSNHELLAPLMAKVHRTCTTDACQSYPSSWPRMCPEAPGWKLRCLCPWPLAPNTSFSKSWVSFDRVGGKHKLSVWGRWQRCWTERNVQHEINNSWSPSEWDFFSFVHVRGAWGWASYCARVIEYRGMNEQYNRACLASPFPTPPSFFLSSLCFFFCFRPSVRGGGEGQVQFGLLMCPDELSADAAYVKRGPCALGACPTARFPTNTLTPYPGEVSTPTQRQPEETS